jgi:2,3-bisphosphoglycerate-independent phosphoglycerate mutase
LCRLLDGQVIDDVEILVRPVKEHRFIVVFRGANLTADLADSDPQQTGVLPKYVAALSPQAEATADIANRFVLQAKTTLASSVSANMLLLRGFSKRPHFPLMSQVYQLNPLAIASYPMYRGLARLVGMEIVETGVTIEDEFATLFENYSKHDFFFLHIKGADGAGEDGDFEGKVRIIEQVDEAVASLIHLDPDVIVVAGDHSTPAVLKGHSWHPVPLLLHSKWCRTDRVTEFSEATCFDGGLGRLPATDIMPLAMANALKLDKFGA